MSIKVLFVMDGLGQGGAERSLAELIPGLKQANIDPTVAFFHRREENLEAVYRARGARLCSLTQTTFAGRVLALRRLIRSERPDVMHTALFQADIIGRLAAIGQDVLVLSSLVNTPYDPICLHNRDIVAPKLWAVQMIDSFTARHLTDHFHAVSEPVKQEAIDTLGLRPERITVIERGRSARLTVPTEDQRKAARRKFGLGDTEDVVLNVARQEYQKGQRYLLQAMVQVARRRPSAVLLIAGRAGKQSQHLSELHLNLGLGDRVRMLGHREDVPDLLAAADVFVFPSLYEGLGGALIEAMALGLPIVASRVPAIQSAVREGHNAILVDRASPAPLANAITAILADRTRAAAYGRCSRQIFEERFTLDHSAERMIELYRQLAGSKMSGVRVTAPVGVERP
jgi:glycosyltransferase involved in cell wall biosynthesis